MPVWAYTLAPASNWSIGNSNSQGMPTTDDVIGGSGGCPPELCNNIAHSCEHVHDGATTCLFDSLEVFTGCRWYEFWALCPSGRVSALSDPYQDEYDFSQLPDGGRNGTWSNPYHQLPA
jgi:hypothetical protein